MWNLGAFLSGPSCKWETFQENFLRSFSPSIWICNVPHSFRYFSSLQFSGRSHSFGPTSDWAAVHCCSSTPRGQMRTSKKTSDESKTRLANESLGETMPHEFDTDFASFKNLSFSLLGFLFVKLSNLSYRNWTKEVFRIFRKKTLELSFWSS